jgi:hypothetical protein
VFTLTHVSTWPSQWRDAASARLHALAVWRATDAERVALTLPDADTDAEQRGETFASRVAWRAVVAALTRDIFGDALPIQSVDDSWLWSNAACVSKVHAGQTQRERDAATRERVAQRRCNVYAVSRVQRLAVRITNLPTGRGKRAELIDKVSNAATFFVARLTHE